MASNFFSRLLPSGSPSIYEAIRGEDDDDSNSVDIEARAGIALDEENLGHRNLQLDPELVDAMENELGVHGSPPSTRSKSSSSQERPQTFRRVSPRAHEADEANDEVPASLLVEVDQLPKSSSKQQPSVRQAPNAGALPVAERATGATRTKWKATQQQQRLYQDPSILPAYAGRPQRKKQQNNLLANPREKALWRWANVQNLDNFIHEVYQYYLGKGIYSILLRSALNLLTSAFVIGFSVFLTSCIDFNKVKGSKQMTEILVPRCTQNMSGFFSFLIFVCAFIWIWQILQTILDIPRLKHMHDFYLYLLEIPETDIQTIQWQEVVKRLMALRDLNPATVVRIPDRHRQFLGTQSKQRMDAHDIANRIMRRDNYMIALINKEILDMTLPIPFLANRSLFSKTMEWNLSLCILDFVFDKRGQPGKEFLRDTSRKELSDSLRLRFFLVGVLDIIIAPFAVIYLIVFYFFQNFSEYQKNPSSIGSRQYTPHAEWKFREFNELSHLFERRALMSYPFAARYINQFPKHKMTLLNRFVAFVSGALAAVLALTSIIDSESFLSFELTPGRSVLFYLTVFTTIYAATRNSGTEETLVFDPEFALDSVIRFTHYLPSHWKGRLHSAEVRNEFAQLYQMKVALFLQEVLSILVTPFVLWFALPKCSERIVDFFREFTIHVDGLGYVCSFAVFDFDKGGDNPQRQNKGAGNEGPDLRDDYYSTKDGKMLASYYNFMDNYVNNPQGIPYQPIPTNDLQAHQAFPGAGSSNVLGDGLSSKIGVSDRPQPSARSFAQAPPRTPRFVPQAVGGHGSPLTSILLDPQHQPPALRGGSRPTTQSRLRNARHPIADVIEDNEEEDGKASRRRSRDAGSVEEDDNPQLGDSWKMTAGELDEPESGEPSSATDHKAGVLGLVYQFSKAQTEGRGTGVDI